MFMAVPGRAQELPLHEAISRAMDKNTSLQAMDARSGAAKAHVREVWAATLPNIAVTGGYTWYEKPNIIFPIHQAGVFPPLDDRIFESSAQMSVPIFSGGRTSALIRAAEAGTNITHARHEGLRSSLVEEIAGIYLIAAELRDKRSIVSAHLADMRHRLFELEVLRSEGRASEAQVALVLANIETVSVDSMQLHFQGEEVAWKLGQMLGTNERLVPDVRSLSIRPPDSLQLDGTAYDRLHANNAEILAAKAQREQAEAMESFARRGFMPDFSGFAVYNYRSGGSAWNPAGEWAAGFRLSIPLLDGGKRLANTHAANKMTRAAELDAKATEQHVHAQWRIAKERHKTALQQRHAAGNAVKNKVNVVEVQRHLYEVGRMQLSELMTQETELLQLQMMEKTHEYTALRATIRYYAISGTLTESVLESIFGEMK